MESNSSFKRDYKGSLLTNEKMDSTYIDIREPIIVIQINKKGEKTLYVSRRNSKIRRGK